MKTASEKSKSKDKLPVTSLYIIMRMDLDSLNPGKAMAQAAHAANQFAHRLEVDEKTDGVWADVRKLYRDWIGQSNQGFGTTITLQARIKTIEALVLMAKEYDLLAEIVHDDTYPLVDGEIVHQIPLDTCAFLFGDPVACKECIAAVKNRLSTEDELILHK